MADIIRNAHNQSDFNVEGLEQDDSVWLFLEKFSIHIMRTDIGISIDVYGTKIEDRDPIATAVAYDDDAESDSEEV
jgi:hypothetical protein